eukprot:577779-Amphidinium_carterae.1
MSSSIVALTTQWGPDEVCTTVLETSEDEARKQTNLPSVPGCISISGRAHAKAKHIGTKRIHGHSPTQPWHIEWHATCNSSCSQSQQERVKEILQ